MANRYLEKIAAWGVYSKDSLEDIHSRTPGGMHDDYARIISQGHTLHATRPAHIINKELESAHSQILKKGIHNTSTKELERLISLRNSPNIEDTLRKKLLDDNLSAMKNVLFRSTTPHSKWYSGSPPSKFHFLEAINLEGLKKLKKVKGK